MTKRKSRVVGPSDGVQCIVTDTGRVVTTDLMKQYEMPQSKQLGEAMFKYGETIDPPHDLVKLMNWMNISVVHSSCIHTKVQDTVGIGFYLEPEDDSKIKDKEKDQNYKSLMEFFNQVNDKEDIITLLKKVAIDYEGCGNAYIEVSRGKDGNINGLYHINATTIKWGKTKDKLIQKVGNKYVWFKLFGNEKILNRFTGQFKDAIDNVDEIANEIIPLTQYSWRSACYGLPEWLPALYSMFGDLKEQEYNIDFFVNYGVPAYALLITGSTLTDEVQEEVTKYFETQLKGSSHKTLTLSTPTGVEMKFERLSVEAKEASFRMYRKDNRDTILTAHHVPPYRASIVEQGQLGGNVATETDRIYLDSVVNPRQRAISWIINRLIIQKGLEITGWEFKFDDINVQDAEKDSQIHQRYFQIGVLSPNEIRKELGLEPYEGGDTYYVQGTMTPIGGEGAEEAQTQAPAKEGLTEGQKSGEEEVDV